MDILGISPGERVLITAGAGGMGHLAVQIARALGAAVIATPVHPETLPDADRVRWRPFNGEPRGSGLIRLAPWFDDGSLSVHVSRRYYWQDAAAAHREVEQGHTRGKLVLIVDDDLAAELGV